jgi:preprotein translocase subunit SecF
MKQLDKSTKRAINAIFWIVAAIALMVTVYFKWSENGEYTFVSFFSSLVIHGGFCALVGMLIDEKIQKKRYR